MIFSKTSRNLSVLAILLATAFFACSSFGGDTLRRFVSASLGQSGAVLILRADGGAPPPPPKPKPIPQPLKQG